MIYSLPLSNERARINRQEHTGGGFCYRAPTMYHSGNKFISGNEAREEGTLRSREENMGQKGTSET